MAIGLNNGVYDSTKFTPPPSPNYSLSAVSLSTYSTASPLSGTTVDVYTLVLDTAGTANGLDVVGVLFNTPTTIHELSALTLTSPDGTDTEIRCRLPVGDVIYTVGKDGFGVSYTTPSGTPALSGTNIAVGSNYRRLRLLGYK